MGQMEPVFRSEVVRLAKKELRAACLPVARDVRKLKRAVSQLSRAVKSLSRLGEELTQKQLEEKAKLAAEPAEVETARFSAGLIRKLRKRLGATQAELARLARVSPATVAFWEQGRTRPTEPNKAALVALRKLGRRDVKRLLAAADA